MLYEKHLVIALARVPEKLNNFIKMSVSALVKLLQVIQAKRIASHVSVRGFVNR